MAWPWLSLAPAGDGHPVLVIPGLLMGDTHTLPLRALLASRGHSAQGWGQGINFGHWDVLPAALEPLLDELCARTARKASLVGWSIGGLFARELARRRPDLVRMVVTLASGVAGSPHANHVWPLYERMTGHPAETLLVEPPPLPSTSIYSRGDGLANWRTCLQQPGPCWENVEVFSNHHGLGMNPWAAYAVADRLAQPEGGWKPFQSPAWGAAAYPRPHSP